MVYFKRLRSSGFVSLEAFKMYYVMRTFAPSLHRKSTDFLIIIVFHIITKNFRDKKFLSRKMSFGNEVLHISRDCKYFHI